MLKNLKNDFIEAITTITPVVLIVLLLSLFIKIDITLLISFLISSVLLIIGSTLFNFGANLSMIVIGNKIGKGLVKSKNVWLILFASLVIGTIITIAEPDLMVLAEQLTFISRELLIFTVSLGLGVCLMLAAGRAIFGWNLKRLIFISYLIVFILAIFVPIDFIPVAFDSGGVTTGTVSIPFIMTLGMGLVSSRIDKKAKEDSFGLVGLASIGPIIMVMLLGMLYKPDSTLELDIMIYKTFEFSNYFKQIPLCLKDVVIAVSPLLGVFVIYQAITKNASKLEIHKIILGTLFTIVGLTLFLVASNVGFLNMGYYIGEYITTSSNKYLLIPIIMTVAFFIAIAEPAVMILVEQVSEFTEGSISKQVLKIALALGVSIAAGLSILRVFTGTPFMYYAIVGYGISLVLMFFIPNIFNYIAFDAGGATGGSLTTTFLLPMTIGACYVSGGNILTDAFGLASLVSLIPIITIQMIGLIYQIKTKAITRIEQLDDTIVDYDWEVSHG